MTDREKLAGSLTLLRREMELRWTGQFVENAVCTIDAARAALSAMPDRQAERDAIVAWVRADAIKAWGADCSGAYVTDFIATAIENGDHLKG